MLRAGSRPWNTSGLTEHLPGGSRKMMMPMAFRADVLWVLFW